MILINFNSIFTMKKTLLSLFWAGMATMGFAQCEPVYVINENFDAWEEIDPCWTDIGNGGMIYADSNVTFYGFMGGPMSMYLITPEIAAGNYTLTFDAASLSLDGSQTEGITLEVGTLTSNADFSSFSSISEVYPLENAGEAVQVPVTASEEVKFIAFKVSVLVPHSAAGIDNVVLTAATAGVGDLNPMQAEIYPNPVRNELNLVSELKMNEIRIFNALGQMVISEKPEALQTKIDVSTLKPGLYIVQILTEKGVQSVKVVKK